MAKPRFGGWVSFTSHLCLKENYKLYKISPSGVSEKRIRDFGYGVKYQNLSIIDILKKKEDILISAIDKNYYKYLEFLPDGTRVVIHDPTEVKRFQAKQLIEHLKRFKVVTIRKSVKVFLKQTYDIDSLFKIHPFYEFKQSDNLTFEINKSISRIDYDKHTEIILDCNNLYKKNINIYGKKNDLYVYRKLGGKHLDKFYKGRFKKCFMELDNILCNAKYIIDMSVIYNDGGGSQYTFLEAMYYKKPIILNSKWLTTPTLFDVGINCLAVSTSQELSDILDKNCYKKIGEEGYKLLKPHLEVKWIF
tara:strand:+ start:2917 stop:3831 length:915 start_codon:yes stop_codon:yes gene_type:complete